MDYGESGSCHLSSSPEDLGGHNNPYGLAFRIVWEVAWNGRAGQAQIGCQSTEILVAPVIRAAGMLSILLGQEKKKKTISQSKDGPNSCRDLAGRFYPILWKYLCRQDFSIPMDRPSVLVSVR